MSDVSLNVAVVTAAAAVGGAAIPAITVLLRDVRQAERDRRERCAEAKRQACLDLLRAAGELRTRVANTLQDPGDQIGARLAEIRESEGAVHLHAAGVALLAPAKLAEPAEALAMAASQVAVTAARDTDRRGITIRPPDFTGLDESVAAFRRMAVADAAE
jgi:hypothetical protein